MPDGKCSCRVRIEDCSVKGVTPPVLPLHKGRDVLPDVVVFKIMFLTVILPLAPPLKNKRGLGGVMSL